MEQYCPKHITFNEVDVEFIKGFKKYLDTIAVTKSQKKLSQNTKHTYFNKFKACLNAAFDEGYLKENLIKRVKGFSMGESTREYLTSDELQALSRTPCKIPLLKRAFLFSALTGIRWSDVNKLKWSEVRDEGIDDSGNPTFRIVFQQKKTEGVEYLYISQQARDLLGERKDSKQRVFKGLRYSAHMIIAEDVGIFKFDILGQRGLAKIKEAVSIIRQNRPEAELWDIKEVERLKRDPNINRLLSKGRAIGAYYVESPAMRGLIKKLGTHDYLGLVAASSVIRPGVSSSGMKDEYIRRERDPERRKQATPILLGIMPETHGIMVYQEDVLKVAHLFAGLDLGKADVLRRGMSGKFRSREEFQAVRTKFFANCKERGHDATLTNMVWEQIESFAGYAFAKGHSASYAVESYQSLYLKCYFPLEFMVAVLNNGGGFYDMELYVHEAKMWGASILPPCINLSDHINVIHGRNIYLGLGNLRDLERPVIQRLLTERQLHGKFRDFDDFIDRVPISIEQLSILVRIDAFRCFGIPKKEVLWHAVFKTRAYGKRTHQNLLFKPRHRNFKLPQLPSHPVEDAYDQLELLGFPLCGYYALMDGEPKSRLVYRDFPDHLNRKILVYGAMVHTRTNTTSKGEIMRFTTMLDLNGEFFDCVHFPQAMDQTPIHGKGIYACYGRVTEEFGHYSLEVMATKKQPLKRDPRQVSGVIAGVK